jgi:peptidoglycan/xylan/chitin deacetylase (PgdA/CDA1 family)
VNVKSGPSAIITYHSLDESGSMISIAPSLFRAQLEALASSRAAVIPLADIRNTRGSVALTFDDGYHNFLETALPVLHDHEMPATLFVVSGYCGRYNQWKSSRRDLPRLKILSWTAIGEIAEAGVVIGAHTVHHPDLTVMPSEQVAQELRECRASIEDRIGRRVDCLAYPYGATSAAVRAQAALEFQLACGTRPAFVEPGSDPLDLPRIDARYLQRLYWMSNLSNGVGRAYISAQRWLGDLRAALPKSS